MIENNRYLFDCQIRKEYNTDLISGTDEVGRGAMAGPIVVASVILKPDYFNKDIKDSKLLSKTKREKLYEEILNNCLSYAICEYDAQVVDKLNPKQTSILGMKETILKLKIKPGICLIDAEKLSIENYFTKSIIKGDNISQSIAAASIVAKVYRDNLMDKFHIQYPLYGFEKHKGYCTKLHIEMVKKLGILPIHRLSYKPISGLKEKN